nr:geranylgeranyl transferase [Cryptomonas paramecium]
MNLCYQVGFIQSHLNFVESIYQKLLNKHSYPLYFKKYLIKIFLIKKLFFYQNTKKTLNFLSYYVSKIWYFLPSYILTNSWVLHWLFVLSDMILFDKKYFLKLKLFSIFSVEKNQYTYNNLSNVLYTYAQTISYVCIKKNLIKSSLVDVKSIYTFIRKTKAKKNFYKNYIKGGSDMRLNYCTLVICSLYNILTPQISSDCHLYIRYTYMNMENSSINKYREEHVALFYCFISSLFFFLKKDFRFSILNSFGNSLFQKKKKFDFSVQGRSYKLTDFCYVYWLNSILLLSSFHLYLDLLNSLILSKNKTLFGFSDKVGRYLDLYHTCYSICGISILSFEHRICRRLPKTSVCSFVSELKKIPASKINPLYGIRESTLVFFLGQ